MKKLLAQLPAVDSLLKREEMQVLIERFTHQEVKRAIKEGLDETRQAILSGQVTNFSLEDLLGQIKQAFDQLIEPTLKATINATGTVLHTNLGRAILADEAKEAVQMAASQYTNLEYDLKAGHRGTRYQHVQDLLKELTGAEDALIVNNNAAAVLLYMTALTKGKEVLISRGELVEIGGSFRIPDVIESCGAILREVGATNKVKVADYQRGINEETGAILRVHTSNYRVLGFTESPSDKDLVALAHENDLPIFNDLGSGLLIDLQPLGLSYEPTIKELIQADYDLVSFSGDKLLGGPQAGVIVGKKKYIDELKKFPLLRALRTDKVTLAGLEATLHLYRDPKKAMQRIPTLQMIAKTKEEVKHQAEKLGQALSKHIKGVEWELLEGSSQVGGGAYPIEKLPTCLLLLRIEGMSEDELEKALRLSEAHIITRVMDGAVCFDLRTVLKGQDQVIVETLLHIVEGKN
ncbi:L-seryl-tRNA(Sec) selenium transferase [Atopobacter sp. AH10]|uniref:L-seryl-tRNA(Sec) selenium transferase n=1 Tax=Atopobacter sp. AH10 TaxID=2315861 RepID=UPI000EF21AB2|nr:L-seryl-tRNA(Sec) selenium transferase [Atopobacter sp. AH10]RLK64111.1 L-seryl-tRNA(Sec) selenium transferase [Atopobacter sp. AH10]